eukprot:20996-Chlamydomonas_euryale.AAC.1
MAARQSDPVSHLQESLQGLSVDMDEAIGLRSDLQVGVKGRTDGCGRPPSPLPSVHGFSVPNVLAHGASDHGGVHGQHGLALPPDHCRSR